MREGAGLKEAPVAFLELSAVGTCELTQHSDIPYETLGMATVNRGNTHMFWKIVNQMRHSRLMKSFFGNALK